MPMTPDDVVSKTFTLTRYREGYDQDEVDDFLDEVVAELRRRSEQEEELRGHLGQPDQGTTGQTGQTGPARDGQDDGEDLTQVQASQDASADRTDGSPTGATAAQAPGADQAAGVLALAQRLHDEYVRSGEQQRESLVGEAQERASRIVAEAQETHRRTLGALENERSSLEQTIEELRGFERDYRARLRSYLEGQLRELDTRAEVVPGSTTVGGGQP